MIGVAAVLFAIGAIAIRALSPDSTVVSREKMVSMLVNETAVVAFVCMFLAGFIAAMCFFNTW